MVVDGKGRTGRLGPVHGHVAHHIRPAPSIPSVGATAMPMLAWMGALTAPNDERVKQGFGESFGHGGGVVDIRVDRA